MKLVSLYSEKLCTPENAISLIEPGDEILVPLAAAEPTSLIETLYRYDKLERNSLYQMLSFRRPQEIDKDKLKVISMFLGSSDRHLYANKTVALLPNHFSQLPRILRERLRQLVIITQVSPIDGDGYFSLGTNCDYTGALLKHAKKIIVQVNEYMPRTYGKNQVHVSEVDAIVELHEPLVETGQVIITEKDKKIGETIAGFVKDGDTIQIGLGAIPSVVMDYLQEFRDLGFYSEIITDKFVDLYNSGAITNRLKPIHQHVSTATLALGTKRLYEFLHENRDIYMLPVDQSNDVREIAKHDQFVSINGAIEIDFLGQCNSEVINGKYYSSSGGQGDFTKGVTMCKEGRGVICLHSTTKNEEVSKIVPALCDNAAVTTSKNDIDYVVTEYGYAQLKGKTISERTAALINIAHPKFRDQLTFEAKKMGYL